MKLHEKGRDPYRILFAFPFIIALWGLFLVFLFWNQYRVFREEYLTETEREMKAQGEIVAFWLAEGNFEKLEKFCRENTVGMRRFLIWEPGGKIFFNSADTESMNVCFISDLENVERDGTAGGTESGNGMETSRISSVRGPAPPAASLHAGFDEHGPTVELHNVSGERRLFCLGKVLCGDTLINWEISMPVEPISAALRWGVWNIWLAGFIGVGLVLVLTHFVAFRLRLPLEKLQKSAAQIASGDLSGPVFVPKKGVVRPLALSVSEMAKQLRRQIGDLTVLGSYRSDFIANVSHEIKTPLTVILSSIETLEDGAKEIPEMRDACLKMLAHQAERLNWLVQDILSLASLEQAQKKGIPDSGFQEVCLPDIFHNVIESCAEGIRQSGIQVNVERCFPEPILADPRLLEQAVTNLLMNALRYSGSQTVELSAWTISFNADAAFPETDAENLVLSVKDHGCGLAETDAERIFERFYRVQGEKRAHAPGTGLGLAIVKHIAQLHGGRAEVVTKLGSGADFRLILPRRPQKLSISDQENEF